MNPPVSNTAPLAPLLLGGHISVAGGLHEAPARAERLGLRAMQIFVRNQRQWSAKPLSDGDIVAWQAALADTQVARVLAHGSYLVNLGTHDPEKREKSIAAMVDELERCQRLGIPDLIFHPGNHDGDGEEAGLRRIASSLDRCIETACAPDVRLLLETTAGQGTCLGHRLEHIAALRDLSRYPGRLYVCLDTCHALAAGYELRTGEGWSQFWADFDRLLGAERLKAVHMNDSKKPLGSRVDRHEVLGEGHLGEEPFRRLVTEPRFRGVPLIMETPDGEERYAEELAWLGRWTDQPRGTRQGLTDETDQPRGTRWGLSDDP